MLNICTIQEWLSGPCGHAIYVIINHYKANSANQNYYATLSIAETLLSNTRPLQNYFEALMSFYNVLILNHVYNDML